MEAKSQFSTKIDNGPANLDSVSQRRQLVEATSHDIRTPLAVISSSAELIVLSSCSKADDLEPTKEELVKLYRQLGRVVGNSLDAECLRVGASGLEIGCISATDLLKSVADSLTKGFRAISFSTSISDLVANLSVRCDSERVAHALCCSLGAFLNLIKKDKKIELFLRLKSPSTLVFEEQLAGSSSQSGAIVEVGFVVEAEQPFSKLWFEPFHETLEEVLGLGGKVNQIAYSDLPEQTKSIVVSKLELSVVDSIAALHSGQMHVEPFEASGIGVWMSIPVEPRDSIAASFSAERLNDGLFSLNLLKQYADETLCKIEERASSLSSHEVALDLAKPLKKLNRIKSNAINLQRLISKLADG